jgi:hypothetical protein
MTVNPPRRSFFAACGGVMPITPRHESSCPRFVGRQPTVFCVSSGNFAGDGALEAAQDVALGLALGGALDHVGAGLGVAARAGQRDAPQRVVGLAATAAVDPALEDPQVRGSD